MSKPRYGWWGYVKYIIRAYPARKQEYEELHRQTITANISGMPGGGGISRGTESIAIRELPGTQQREFEAVRRAIQATKQLPTGRERLELIEMVFWKKSHTLSGAAYKLNLSYTTAQRYHGEFVLSVAGFYGLMDLGDTG